MAIPQNTPSNEVVLTATSAALETAASIWLVSPVKGKLVRGYHVITVAHTGTNGTWTVEVEGSAATGTGTFITASSAAGDTAEVIYSGDVAVNPGDAIEIVLGGEGDDGEARFALVIRT